MRGHTLTLAGLGVVLAYAVYCDGGVQTAQWHWCLLGFGIVCATYWMFNVPTFQRPTSQRPTSHVPSSQRPNVQRPTLKRPTFMLLLPCYALAQFFVTSIKPAATFEHLLRILAYIAVYFTIRGMKSRWAALPIIIVAAIEAALGIMAMNAETGAHGTYVNRNHFAGLLEMSLPFAVVGAFRDKWLWIPAGIIFAGIVCSYSRGGFLTTLCVLCLMGILSLNVKRGTLNVQRWIKWVAPVPILAGALFLFLYLPPDPFFKRFSEASEEQVSTLGGRLLFLQQAPPLIKKYAAFGCGLGGFESAFYKIKDILPGHTVDYAHNDYVQAMIELGIIGFLLVAVLIGSAFRQAIRAGHIACIGALAAILLHSFVDFNLYIPANAMVLGWIAGTWNAERPTSQRPTSNKF